MWNEQGIVIGDWCWIFLDVDIGCVIFDQLGINYDVFFVEYGYFLVGLEDVFFCVVFVLFGVDGSVVVDDFDIGVFV